ncbi:unnamed protein product [Ixodes persulcatus]
MAASPFSPERALVSKWRAASAAWQAWRNGSLPSKNASAGSFFSLPASVVLRIALPGFQLSSRRVHWTFEPSLMSALPLPRSWRERASEQTRHAFQTCSLVFVLYLFDPSAAYSFPR